MHKSRKVNFQASYTAHRSQRIEESDASFSLGAKWVEAAQRRVASRQGGFGLAQRLCLKSLASRNEATRSEHSGPNGP
jgi:hypothetical protein